MVADENAQPAAVWRRAVLTAVICAILLVAVYLLAVWTRAGQRFEDAVLNAASAAAGQSGDARATDTLDAVTAPFLAGATLVVLAIGLLRHRLFLGLVGACVIGASVLTAEVVRRLLLRPVLLPHGYRREDQSFPSGHSAVAMSVMCALILVVPQRWRGVVAAAGSLWAASVVVATVTASWHRPSDTLGSDLIVAGYTCVAIAVLARRGYVRPVPGRIRVPRRVYGAVAVLAFLAVTVAGAMAIDRLGGIHREALRGYLLTAGRGLALAGTVAVTLVVLAVLRRVDLAPPVSRSTLGEVPTR
ncbi:MAG TPA: phosphatase PAP2 family protein [Rugosimonospora sp.]|nr:phosphatase PAP2 family protein [Rugosimonospora sp.]